jgi:EmrB/QacA subfamily drug resistance transporter
MDTVEEERVSLQTKLSIFATAMVSFIGILTETSLNVTFTTMTKQFDLPLSTVQLLTSGYLLMVTLVMSTSSFLLKRFSARSLFRYAICASFIGVTLCAIPSNYWVLLIGRLLQATGTGISTPLMMHVILALVPTQRRGTYLGLATMVTSFAPALGPTYGGLINYYFSWHIIFVLILPLIVIAGIVGDMNLRLPAQGTNRSFDALGLVYLVFSLFGLTQVFDQGGAYGFGSPLAIAAFVTTIVAFALLIHHSITKPTPLLNLRLLRIPTVGLRAVNFFILQFINIGSSFLLPIFMQMYVGTDSLQAGLLLLPGSLLGALVAPLAGSLYDHKGAKATLTVSNVLIIIGTIAIWVLTADMTVPIITGLYMFLRVGFNFGYGNTMTDASKFVGFEQQTDFNSLFNTLQQYAGSLGTSVLSSSLALAELRIPNDSKSAAVAGARDGFTLLIVMSLIALASTCISLALKRKAPVQMREIKV